ncbi:MAG: zinc-binding dehydrogenase [Cytophagales bacterium]|nr:zinc-binding dehydrogenase [Cytophagales bacterium]
MKALVLIGPGIIEWKEVEKPTPSLGQALVKMKAVSLNRRDEWIKKGMYPNIRYGGILGSDGSGVVDSVGTENDAAWLGKEVVINPNINWGPDPDAQAKDYTILGMPVNGTFAEYCLVNVDRLQPKPAHLDIVHAAAIPLGGLTAYRALFRQGGLRLEENVLISGFGGGVAQFCFLFAQAAGANVYVTSGSDEKIARALKMGAKGAYNYRKESTYPDLWKTKGGFDLVIDSAGGDQLNGFIKILKPNGKIVFYGATNGLPSTLDLYRMFWNHLTLQGTTMGNDEEFRDMLVFIAKHTIRPMVDSIRPISKLVESFSDITLPNKVGKIVFQL